ncbi:MAG TPA: exodeoxyribonuclease VII small subunit [Candidatus Caccomonas pullistercoris]|nr:exodeoxyribonuclease VII small subunit [Candidatus Caccomonas pullistercoris]
MPKKETLSYEAAMQRLEDIVRKIENNEIGIDRLAEQLKEAQALIKQCKKQLLAVDKDINGLLADEETTAQ